jgi:hypothetical protein
VREVRQQMSLTLDESQGPVESQEHGVLSATA